VTPSADQAQAAVELAGHAAIGDDARCGIMREMPQPRQPRQERWHLPQIAQIRSTKYRLQLLFFLPDRRDIDGKGGSDGASGNDRRTCERAEMPPAASGLPR